MNSIKKLDEFTDLKFSNIPSEIPQEVIKDIFDIIGDLSIKNPLDDRLVGLLVLLKKYGFIDYSDNPINQFETEKEIKVLEVNVEDLIEILEKIGAKKVFEGFIDDTYCDYSDDRLDSNKRSFRIRVKDFINDGMQIYYTIKRKEKEETKKTKLRTSREKELQVINPQLFWDLIQNEGLRKVRRKVKYRISYIIEGKGIKFDIDNYNNPEIPPLLEIEVESLDLCNRYIEILGLKSNETTTCGSRGLFKRYGATQEIFLGNEIRPLIER